QVALHALDAAECPVAVDLTTRVGRELFPSEKDGEVTVTTSFAGTALGEVVAQDQGGEVPHRRADRRHVPDDMAAEACPDGLKTERIAGSLNGGLRIEVRE